MSFTKLPHNPVVFNHWVMGQMTLTRMRAVPKELSLDY